MGPAVSALPRCLEGAGAGVLTRRKTVICLSESCPWKTVIDPSAVATLLDTVSRS